ncbi:MAG: efflux transporter periplasmic adaptor subunit [Gammaproteobacteria bacterium]|nr:MAG: efflux transporter periplasmic adaptor subunit [Gammaproteobacteria bacterium]
MIKDTSQQDVAITPKFISTAKIKYVALFTVSLLLLSYFAYGSYHSDRSIARNKVQIDTVVRGTLERDINAVGKIVAANAPIIYGSARGTITLSVKPGDAIEKNQLIATINSPELLNQLQQEQASLQSLQFESERQKLQIRRSQLNQQQQLDMALVSLNAAKREFNRSQISIKDNLISQLDFEKSQDDLIRAKLEYTHQQKQALLNQDSLKFDAKTQQAKIQRQQWLVANVQRQVNNLALLSPIDGIVGNWLTSQKSAVVLSQPVMTIVDLSAFEAELLVPESYADELGLDMDVELQVAGQTLQGKLSAISPEVIKRQVTTRVRFSNDKVHLRQNQRLSARIILARKTNVLMVHRGDFLQTGGDKGTYLVQQNIATKVPLTFGETSLSQIEITSGAQMGDKLVISSLTPFAKAKQVTLR